MISLASLVARKTRRVHRKARFSLLLTKNGKLPARFVQTNYWLRDDLQFVAALLDEQARQRAVKWRRPRTAISLTARLLNVFLLLRSAPALTLAVGRRKPERGFSLQSYAGSLAKRRRSPGSLCGQRGAYSTRYSRRSSWRARQAWRLSEA